MSPKRLFATILLTLFMITVMANTANAVSRKAESIHNEEVSYYMGMLKQYIELEQIENIKANLTFTRPLLVSNAENDKKIIFLFSDGDCIGIMSYSNHQGSFVSSFMKMDIPFITTCVATEKKCALFLEDNLLWAVSGDCCERIIGRQTNTIVKKQKYGSFVQKQLELENIYDKDEASIKSNYGSWLLTVPIVSNATSPDTNTGLCWAASAASVILYRNSSFNGGSLDALSLYNYLKILFPPSWYGFPEGTDVWYLRAFGIGTPSYSHVHSGTGYSTVRSIIANQNRPIFAGLYHTASNDNDEDANHVVVICGCDHGHGSYFYRIMDPNMSSYVIVPLTNGNYIYDAINGPTYETWYCRIW